MFCFVFSILQRYFSSVGNSPGRRKSKSRKGPAKIAAIDVLEYIIKHIMNKETPSHVVRVLLATLKKVVTKASEKFGLKLRHTTDYRY